MWKYRAGTMSNGMDKGVRWGRGSCDLDHKLYDGYVGLVIGSMGSVVKIWSW